MLDKNNLLAVIMLYFFSLIAFTVGILSNRPLLFILGAIIGACGLFYKHMKLSCPYCGNSIKLSDLLKAEDTPHQCNVCKKKFRVK